MTRLASLSGQGLLFVGSDDLGEVEYQIDVFVDPTSKDGRGWMTGDFRALEKAFTSQDVTPRFKSGKRSRSWLREQRRACCHPDARPTLCAHGSRAIRTAIPCCSCSRRVRTSSA